MDIQEEIARAILPALDRLAHAAYRDERHPSEAESAQEAAAALMPLVRRAQAEAWDKAFESVTDAAAAEERAEYWENEYRTAEDMKAELRAALAEQGTEEWEYGACYQADNGRELLWFSMGNSGFAIREAAEKEVERYADAQIKLCRRRKASPWVPVDQPASTPGVETRTPNCPNGGQDA